MVEVALILVKIVIWLTLFIVLERFKRLTGYYRFSKGLFIDERVGTLHQYSLMNILKKAVIKLQSSKIEISDLIIFYIMLVLLLLGVGMIPLSEPLFVQGLRFETEMIRTQSTMAYILSATFLMALPFSYFKGPTIENSTSEKTVLVLFLGLLLVSSLMCYSYGTLDLHDMIQIQKSTLWAIFPRYGVIVYPLSFLAYYALMIILLKSLNLELENPKETNSSQLYFSKLILYRGIYFLLLLLGALFFLAGYAPIPGTAWLTSKYPIFILPVQGMSLLVKVELLRILISYTEKSHVAYYRGQSYKDLINLLIPFVLTILLVQTLIKLGSL